MNKYTKAVLLFALLLTGCISTEVRHKQYVDGSADITQIIDLSILSSYGNSSYGSSYSLTNSLDTLCDKYERKGVNCEQHDGVITLSKNYPAANAFYKFEVRDDIFVKKYRLTVDKLESLGDYSDSLSSTASTSDYTSPYYSTSSSGSSYSGLYSGLVSTKNDIMLSGSNAKLVGGLYEQMRIQYTYVVQMPGKITEADGATNITSNTATFDLVKQLKQNKPIVVVSEEVNWIIVIGTCGLGLLVVLIAVAMVLTLLRPKSQV